MQNKGIFLFFVFFSFAILSISAQTAQDLQKQIDELKQIIASMQGQNPNDPQPMRVEEALNKMIPVGTILPYYGTNEPKEDYGCGGWLICDGREIDSSQNPGYRRLVLHLQSLGYQGSSKTSAKLPDLRGMFLRGVDSSRKVGDFQGDASKSHQHTGNTLPQETTSTQATPLLA